jgi:hypothetical protein
MDLERGGPAFKPFRGFVTPSTMLATGDIIEGY